MMCLALPGGCPAMSNGITGDARDTELLHQIITLGNFDSVIKLCWNSKSVCRAEQGIGDFPECISTPFSCGCYLWNKNTGNSYEYRLCV